VERRLVPTDHDRERALFGLRDTSGDRRVDHVRSRGAHSPGVCMITTSAAAAFFPGRVLPLHPARDQQLGGRDGAVRYVHLVARVEQAAGKAPAHRAQTDHTDGFCVFWIHCCLVRDDFALNDAATAVLSASTPAADSGTPLAPIRRFRLAARLRRRCVPAGVMGASWRDEHDAT
jgi:hypothetical protein